MFNLGERLGITGADILIHCVYRFCGFVMEWEHVYEHLEENYIAGDFSAVELALKSRLDLGSEFPCDILCDAVRIGRHRTVQLLLENYRDVCTDSETLTEALHQTIKYHDVRLLNALGYLDEHIIAVTLRNALVGRHCPCERANILNSLLQNGAKIDQVCKNYEEFLMTSPIVCPTALACSTDVLVDYGCNLAPLLEKQKTCEILFDLSPSAFCIILRTASRKCLEFVLPLILQQKEEKFIQYMHECGLIINRKLRDDILSSIPDLKEMEPVLELHNKPSSLRDLARLRVRQSLAEKQSKTDKHRPISAMIRKLDYPQILQRYLSFNSSYWKRW